MRPQQSTPKLNALFCFARTNAEFLASVERKGELLRSGLRQALAGNPHVKVRVCGSPVTCPA